MAAAIDEDWGFEEVVDGRNSRVGLRGEMNIAVTRRGPVSFRVGGDDGYRLSITGGGLLAEELLSDWDTHSYREQQILRTLDPGIYSLALDYFEWTGGAHLTVNISPDVVGWYSIDDCDDAASLILPGSYTVLTTNEPLSDIASRFDVDADDLLTADYAEGPEWVLVPGPLAPPRKAIIIQGIDSTSDWHAEQADEMDGGLQPKVDAIVAAVQADAWNRNLDAGDSDERVPVIDSGDVITFSYSGDYLDILTDELVVTGEHSGTNRHFASYSPAETCDGVAAGASLLGDLIERLVEIDPGTRIDLIGHSMGGLVATYWATTETNPTLLSAMSSLTTLDSPLMGTDIVGPGTQCQSSDSEGTVTYGQAWHDLGGYSDVVSTISLIDVDSYDAEFYSVTGSLVGDAIPGVEPIDVDCSSGAAFLGGIFGWLLFGPLAGILAGVVTDTVVGHQCVWSDGIALQTIADAINSN